MSTKSVVMVPGSVHPVPPRKGAAVEWWMVQVCRQLREYQPHIISIGGEGYASHEKCDGVEFHRITMSRAYKRVFQKWTRWDPYSYAHRVARQIDEIQPDWLHVHNAPGVYQQLQQLCRWQPKHTVLHLHNEMSFAGKCGESENVLVVSDYLAGWARQQSAQAKIDVITNGVDVDVFKPRADNERLDIRRRYGIADEQKVVMYVGRISPEKGTLDLVRAFSELAKQRTDVVLVIAGELRQGASTDKRAAYGQQVRQACGDLSDRAKILGVIEPTQVQDIYQLGDLLVVPSRFQEPFGMVAIEAMASGLPVLAVRRGGLPEFIEVGKTGFLIEDMLDAEAVAKQIDAVLSTATDGLNAIKQNARDYVFEYHSWHVIAQQLERYYKKCETQK